MNKEIALPRLARAAVDVESLTGFPAEVLLAQSALESGWLKSCPGNNPFGIKFTPGRHAKRQLLRTTEWFTPAQLQDWLQRMPGRSIVRETERTDARGRRMYVVEDWFAEYDSLAEACADYVGMLMRGRYETAWRRYQETRDWRRLVEDIAEAGYATAPDYAKRVMAVLDEMAIQALHAAREELRS